jgi:hypothetical protein
MPEGDDYKHWLCIGHKGEEHYPLADASIVTDAKEVMALRSNNWIVVGPFRLQPKG